MTPSIKSVGGGYGTFKQAGQAADSAGCAEENVTRNKLDKTVTPQETAKITEDNAKKRWM